MDIFDRQFRLRQLFSDQALLLDVRTLREFQLTGINGAQHLPYEQVPAAIPSLKQSGQPIIVYSTYGERSRTTADLLKQHDIYAFDGGSMRILEKILFKEREIIGYYLSREQER